MSSLGEVFNKKLSEDIEKATRESKIKEIKDAIVNHANEVVDLKDFENKEIKAARSLHVLNCLFKKAIDGDVRAAEAYLDRSIGKPKQEIDQNLTGNFSLADLAKKANENSENSGDNK